MKNIERRIVAGQLQTRAAAEGETRTLSGLAAVFGRETVIGSWFREVIAPGAFTESIAQDDVRALFNHDPNLVLGRNTSGTLTLSEDEDGLRYDVTPPDTTYARDLMVVVDRGDVSQSSFGFEVPDDGDEWNYDETKEGKLPLRTITKARLWDVSPVTYPAYTDTTVSARAQQKAGGAADAHLVAAAALSAQLDAIARARSRLRAELDLMDVD